MKKHNLPMFPDHSDPQKALENFRTLVLGADASDHQDAFLSFNKATAIHNLVTTAYRGARASSDEAVELKGQIMKQIELFYKYIVLDEEVPDDLDTSLLKKMSIVPVGLVAKLGLEGRYRDEPAAAGRVNARSQLNQQKKTKAKKRAAGCGNGGGSGSNSKKTAKVGKETRGMKQGAKRVYDNPDKTKWHMEYPADSCKPKPNNTYCSISSSSSSSSSSSQIDGKLLEELKLKGQLYDELETKYGQLQLQYEGVIDAVHEHNQHIVSKNQQHSLSQQSSKMAIHMAAMGPQLMHDDAAKVVALMVSPSPTKKMNLQGTLGAKDGGADE